jgi:enoyl-CoA hydratase/carnithine racemase
MFESDSSELLCELRDRVLTITFNRPDARNALSTPLTKNFRGALAWATSAKEVGAVVVTGAGKAFCAGGDVKRMGGGSSKPAPSLESQFQEMRARHHETAGVLRNMRKPTIAALPGAAAGAGLAIALACDMRLGARSAFVATGYAGIGLPGDYGVAWLLTRTIGPAKAREYMLTNERITAAKAESLGLFNLVVEDSELQVAAFEFAKNLANGPQVAFGYIKDNLDEAFEIDHASAIDREADRLLKARTTTDHKEAVKAFAEKRQPTFTGE